jgi:hypothetical protein
MIAPSYGYRLAWAYLALALGLLLFVVAFRFDTQTGFTSLIRFGELRSADRVPELQNVAIAQIKNHPGYDGQFYAQLALRPQLTDAELQRCLDDTHYRARRVFLPALAHVLGLGNPWAVVHLYASLNLLCWGLLGWLLLYWLPPTSWENFGRWAAAMLSSGALESVRAALTDLPAALILVLGLRLWEAGHQRWALLPLAAAGLTRETSLLGFGLLAPGAKAGGILWLRSLMFAGLGALPIILWMLYLRGLFPQGVSGWVNFSWPFADLSHGAWQALSMLSQGYEDRGRYTFRLIAVVALTVQVVVLARAFRLSSPWSRLSLGFIVLLPFLGALVWDGYWAVMRTLLPMTLAFCVLLPRGRFFWLWLIIASLPSLHAIFRLAF